MRGSPPAPGVLGDSSVTDYVLEAPAKCPNCRREIKEKTLVEPMPDFGKTVGGVGHGR
jgi:hypothetical protein